MGRRLGTVPRLGMGMEPAAVPSITIPTYLEVDCTNNLNYTEYRTAIHKDNSETHHTYN